MSVNQQYLTSNDHRIKRTEAKNGVEATDQVAYDSEASSSADEDRHGEDDDGDDDDEDDESEEAEVESSEYGDVNAAAMQEVEAAVASGLPYMKGDSYPDTTSGQPSVGESDIEVRKQTQQASTGVQRSIPERSSGNRQRLAAQPVIEQRVPHALQRQPQGLPEQHASGAYGVTPAAPKRQAASRKIEPRRLQLGGSAAADNPRQREQNGRTRLPAVSNNTAQQASAPEVEYAAQQSAAREQQARRAQPKFQGETATSTTPGKAATGKGHQAFQPMVETLSLHTTGVSTEDHKHGDAEDIRLKETTPSELDYQVPNLYSLQYSDIKAQVFDTDPNGGVFAAPIMNAGGSVADKLEAVANMDLAAQGQFVASLAVDDWEEAGDWFLGQFGDVLQKLKTLRREKRKAARGFEEEVERRHYAVTKKRKLTEDALGEMKKSGGMVLEGTPKKKTKTAK